MLVKVYAYNESSTITVYIEMGFAIDTCNTMLMQSYNYITCNSHLQLLIIHDQLNIDLHNATNNCYLYYSIQVDT